MRFSMGYLPALDAVFDKAVDQIKAAGAEVVSIDKFAGMDAIEKQELTILLTDFRKELNAYLASTPPSVTTRTLKDLIAFNLANAAREMPHFGQELFEQSEQTAGHDAGAYARMRDATKAASRDGIDAILEANKLDALIAPTLSPAWTTDLVNGDHVLGGATALAAVAGYPHLTVPMGFVQGLPVGLSFVGTAWSEAALLGMGHAFEQRTRTRHPPSLP
jgi:amidase